MKTIFTILALFVSLATANASIDVNVSIGVRGDTVNVLNGTVQTGPGNTMYYYLLRYEDADSLFLNPTVSVPHVTGGGGLTTFQLVDTGLTPGTLYRYWLKAENDIYERDSAYLEIRTSEMPQIGQDLTGTNYSSDSVEMHVTIVGSSWYTKVDFIDVATNTIVYSVDSILGQGFMYVDAYFTQPPGTTKNYRSVSSNISHTGVFDTSNVWTIIMPALPVATTVDSMHFVGITTTDVTIHPYWTSDTNGGATIFAFASCDSFATPPPVGTWFVTPGGSHDSTFTITHSCGASADVWVMIVIQKFGIYDTLVQKYSTPLGAENLLPRIGVVDLATASVPVSVYPFHIGPAGGVIQILWVSSANVTGPEQAQFANVGPGDTSITVILQGMNDSCYFVRTQIYENDGSMRGTAYGQVPQVCFLTTGIATILSESDFPAYVEVLDLYGKIVFERQRYETWNDMYASLPGGQILFAKTFDRSGQVKTKRVCKTN